MIPDDQRLGWEAWLDSLQEYDLTQEDGEDDGDLYRSAARDLFRRQRAQAFRAAAVELLERNADERDRLVYAQRALLAGLIAIIVAMAIWMYTGPQGETAQGQLTGTAQGASDDRTKPTGAGQPTSAGKEEAGAGPRTEHARSESEAPQEAPR